MAIFTALTAALGGTAAAGATAGAAGAASGISGAAGAIGALTGIAGTAMQYAGSQKAQEGQERAEKLREAQMTIESTRQKRQIIRQALVARSDALTAATSQGAAQGSGLQGGLAQIGGQANTNLTGVNQSQQLGQEMFAANRTISRGQTMQSTGSGLSSLGGALVKNQETIGRVGAYSLYG